MGLIPDQEHLTVINPELESKRRRTYPGMAHFAGEGPLGKTCRDCWHWTGCGLADGWYSKNGKHGGVLKPRCCDRYRELMCGSIGPAVPHDAMACKHFEPATTPPSIVEP